MTGGLIAVEEALRRVLALATPLPVEEIPLAEAAGRWLAAPLHARREQPPFASSAMDGYAVMGPAPAGEVFRVIGEAGAGHAYPGTPNPGEALRIFTGAPVPEGASQVVIQENTRREGDRITVTEASDATNIRPRGGDFDTEFIFGPRRLRAADLGLIAAMNLPRVPVSRRPEVAIISTGDELRMPGETPAPDQIIASNAFMLKALVEECGGRARILPIARDDLASLAAVFDLAAGADLVVTSGGASVGDHDLVAREAAALGLVLEFHRIRMRPGKPLMAGLWRGVPMLGLPGNPVSAFVCSRLFLQPLLAAMQGEPEPGPQVSRATLAVDCGPAGPRSHYMRARLTPGPDLPLIEPFPDQDSSLQSILAQADALLIRPAGDGPRLAGEEVEYLTI